MAKYVCKKCNTVVPKKIDIDHKCPKCSSDLNYLGKCGECLNFQEFYSGVGTCEQKKNTRRESEGCIYFL